MKKSYHHRGGDVPLLGTTIPEHFAEIVERFPERDAVVSTHQGRRLSYRELADAVDELARGLLGIGIERGDRVGVWSTNHLEWLLLQMATARIGAVQVNLNPAYRTAELAYALEHAEVGWVFTIPSFKTSRYVEMLAELLPELKSLPEPDPPGTPPANLRSERLPHLVRVIVFDPADPVGTGRPYPGFTTWGEVIAAGEAIEPGALDAATAALDPDDTINIQYTSGTTGFPKAVMLTHHNILNNAYFIGRGMAFTEKDRLCDPVPFYHCFGMVIGNLLCLSCGACIVLPAEFFDPERTLESIEAERCTAVHGVPTMFIAELEHPRFAELDLSCLRTGIMAGAPCPPSIMKRVIEEMGCSEILIAYGQTESSPGTHLTSRDDSLERRTETVGTNLPHQEVKVIDTETGAVLPRGEKGEICFRGYHVMKGYYGDPEATRAAIDEAGWLHSGDLGRMDEDGYLRITGRVKDMIIRAGENIYPAEVENLLFTHPKVSDVAVFGVPHEFYGEQVAAWIRLHEGEEATPDEMREFCRDKIAHFKVPAHIWFVEEFPLTVTGKIQKFRMSETAAQALEEEQWKATASGAEISDPD